MIGPALSNWHVVPRQDGAMAATRIDASQRAGRAVIGGRRCLASGAMDRGLCDRRTRGARYAASERCGAGRSGPAAIFTTDFDGFAAAGCSFDTS